MLASQVGPAGRRVGSVCVEEAREFENPSVAREAPLPFVSALRCRGCGESYPPSPVHVCELCFGPLDVVYEEEGRRRSVSRGSIERGPATLWRYKDLLPVGDGPVVDLGAGLTRLVRASNLGRALGIQELFVKDDTSNPTHSFKDRVVAVALTKALEFGFRTVACASTGNLANAVAAGAAKAGLRAVVFVPEDLEPAKVAQTAAYGAKVVAIKGTYDDVNRLCSEVADRFPWAFVNVNLRPFYAEGSKTIVYEVVEQLGWSIPDHIVVPVASGSLLTKVHKGIRELVSLGLVEDRPVRLWGAQAAGCSPVAAAFEAGLAHVRPVRHPRTIVKSLAIGNPADGDAALQVVRETGGGVVAVDDDEVREAILLLASTEGIFAETAGGVSVAAARRLAMAGEFKPGDRVVVLVTGDGLKTLDALEGRLGPTLTVAPRLEDFEVAAAGVIKEEAEAR